MIWFENSGFVLGSGGCGKEQSPKFGFDSSFWGHFRPICVNWCHKFRFCLGLFGFVLFTIVNKIRGILGSFGKNDIGRHEVWGAGLEAGENQSLVTSTLRSAAMKDGAAPTKIYQHILYVVI